MRKFKDKIFRKIHKVLLRIHGFLINVMGEDMSRKIIKLKKIFKT